MAVKTVSLWGSDQTTLVHISDPTYISWVISGKLVNFSLPQFSQL